MIEALIAYLLAGSIIVPMLIVVAIETGGYVRLPQNNPFALVLSIVFLIVFWPIITFNAFT